MVGSEIKTESLTEKDRLLALFVDDALVYFDNARARAALKVLGDLAASTQVIFFTHHAHMVHLAGEAVDGQILHVQELGETGERQ